MDESVWMAGVGNSVLDRAVTILLGLGVSAVVVFVCLLMVRGQLRLLRWAIRRPFHKCAACHARDSSVALWGQLDGTSPRWLCAECAFGVNDFDEVPRSRRQLGAQIASRAEHLGRAVASWSVPTAGGGGRHRRARLRHHAPRQPSVPTASGGGKHRRTARRPYDLASPA